MTEEERKDYIDKLKAQHTNLDKEIAHCMADYILCDILIELGYDDVVDAYHDVPKWYA